MLELNPVSKFIKEKHMRFIKQKHKEQIHFNINLIENGYNIGQLIQQETNKIKIQQNYQSRQFEDSRLTKFIHQQIIIIKSNLNLLAVISILLSVLKNIINFDGQIITYVLILHSIISILMAILVVFKFIKTSQLKIKQLRYNKKENIFMKGFKYVWPEILFFIIHPNLLTKGFILHVSQLNSGETMPLELNSIFQIIMLGRIYVYYDYLVSISIYSTTRAYRMCRIYGTKEQDVFGLKSVFNVYPLKSLLILFVTLVMIYSQMLSLAEENNKVFNYFQDYIWCVIITMGTIGYGDYYPITYFGRIISFSAAITGIIMSSLLIISLSQYLSMNKKQTKAHITARRLQLRQLLQKYAQQTVVQTSNMTKSKASKCLDNLKKKNENLKTTMRRLKNMVDNQSLNEEINNLFESLYSNMLKIYINQETYAQQLMELLQKEGDIIEEIKFSFADQIQKIIKDQ